MDTIPVVDLFAGPGGLGEGFSGYSTEKQTKVFDIKLSVEKDEFANQTLLLRSFFRQFKSKEEVPECYYDFLRSGKNTSTDFKSHFLGEKYQKEWDQALKEAWHHTLGEDMKEVHSRLKSLLKGQSNWILIGGPPCQAYSIAGRGRTGAKLDPKDTRVFLYKKYLEIIGHHAPPVFVMENVRGLLSAKINSKPIFPQILKDLSAPFKALKGKSKLHPGAKSYRIFSFVKNPSNGLDGERPFYRPNDYLIESEKYGIPQTRHRVILLGIRSDIQLDHLLTLQEEESVCVQDVLEGLPKIRSGLSRGRDDENLWKTEINRIMSNGIGQQVREKCLNGESVWENMRKHASFIMEEDFPFGRGGYFLDSQITIKSEFLSNWYLDPRIGGICNHYAREHMTSDLWRYLFSASYGRVNEDSPKLRHYPEGLLPDHKNRKTSKFADRFRTQLSGNPSTTITSHLSRDGHYYIHPDPGQCRSLTVREAARLQTFPDNYYFLGSRTAQYTQVGNAVPPLLASKLAHIVYGIFRQMNSKKSSSVQKERKLPSDYEFEKSVQ